MHWAALSLALAAAGQLDDDWVCGESCCDGVAAGCCVRGRGLAATEPTTCERASERVLALAHAAAAAVAAAESYIRASGGVMPCGKVVKQQQI